MPRNNTEVGREFVEWLKNGIASRSIIINDAKAQVHTVAGTAMLVTPGIFKRYVLEFPHIEQQAKAQQVNAWQMVQRSFEKLKLHKKLRNTLIFGHATLLDLEKLSSSRGTYL